MFWVHQHKLTEGLDELSFCVLAIYDSFGNARQLIQQVGRIIRNKYPLNDNPALILCSPWGRERGFWRGYLKYEEKYEDNLDLNFHREMFDSIHAVMPPHIYDDKTFRTKFEPTESDLYKSYKFRFACNIYLFNEKYPLETLAGEIKSEWLKDDLDIRKESPEWPKHNVFILTYLKYTNDHLLSDRYLFGYKVGFLLCAKIKDYLFVYSSEGRSSAFIKTHFRTLHPEELKKFFAGESTAVKNVTLRSTDLGNHIVRRQNLQALSLENTAHELVDYISFFSTAVAKPKELPHQRYIGFTRSRISDQTEVYGTFDEYYQWLYDLSVAIQVKKTGKKVPRYFERFAKFANEPENTEPTNIVLDLEEAVPFFVHRETKQQLSLDERCHDIMDGVLTLEANGTKYDIGISYNYEKKKYILEKRGTTDITTDFIYIDTDTSTKSENVLRYLNREQRFRIIPQTEGIIYAHKQFYEPRLSLTDVTQGDQLSLFDLFFPIKELGIISSEKGRTTVNSGEAWSPNSLFGFIDALGRVGGDDTIFTKELGGAIDYVICDDSGDNETCDFIIGSVALKKVIFVHAKAYSHGRKRSASAFQEVFGQAIKNLSYLVPTEINSPPNLHLWDNGWSAYVGKDDHNQSITLKIHRRIRRGKGPGLDIWNSIKQLIRNPTASREVWIVLGNAFSLKEFQKLHQAKEPETIQIIYMLQSTWSNINKVATQFKIYCSP